MEIKTSIGKIVTVKSCDKEYPGIWLSFVPKGTNTYVSLALLEVTEKTNPPKLHLRPFMAEKSHMYDENGNCVEGKISFDAPFDDREISLEAILSEMEA